MALYCTLIINALFSNRKSVAEAKYVAICIELCRKMASNVKKLSAFVIFFVQSLKIKSLEKHVFEHSIKVLGPVLF